MSLSELHCADEVFTTGTMGEVGTLRLQVLRAFDQLVALLFSRHAYPAHHLIFHPGAKAYARKRVGNRSGQPRKQSIKFRLRLLGYSVFSVSR